MGKSNLNYAFVSFKLNCIFVEFWLIPDRPIRSVQADTCTARSHSRPHLSYTSTYAEN